jgi:hypothetical protein
MKESNKWHSRKKHINTGLTYLQTCRKYVPRGIALRKTIKSVANGNKTITAPWINPSPTGDLRGALSSLKICKSLRCMEISSFIWSEGSQNAWGMRMLVILQCETSVHRLDYRGDGVRVPVVENYPFSTSSRPAVILPTSYPVGTEGYFPWGKVAAAWSWPLTYN